MLGPRVSARDGMKSAHLKKVMFQKKAKKTFSALNMCF